jgi:hypothetical protein
MPKNKSSISLLQSASEEIRHSSATNQHRKNSLQQANSPILTSNSSTLNDKVLLHSGYENNEPISTKPSCTPLILQNSKYDLFVSKKIDKYLPYDDTKDLKKLQKIKNNKDYFNQQIRRCPKNRK